MKCLHCGKEVYQIIYIPEVDMKKEPYKNPPIDPQQKRRESPQDFMLAFARFLEKEPERKITPKAFAIIRAEREQKAK